MGQAFPPVPRASGLTLVVRLSRHSPAAVMQQALRGRKVGLVHFFVLISIHCLRISKIIFSITSCYFLAFFLPFYFIVMFVIWGCKITEF